MRILVLTAPVGDRLASVFAAAFPAECCGLLVGTATDRIACARRVMELRNANRSAGRFALLDADFRRAQRVAARDGLQVVAMFHSHPSGSCDLSTDDRSMLKHAPFPWVVFSMCGTPPQLQLSAYHPSTCDPLTIYIDY